jgi:hypothetical protein
MAGGNSAVKHIAIWLKPIEVKIYHKWEGNGERVTDSHCFDIVSIQWTKPTVNKNRSIGFSQNQKDR